MEWKNSFRTLFGAYFYRILTFRAKIGLCQRLNYRVALEVARTIKLFRLSKWYVNIYIVYAIDQRIEAHLAIWKQDTGLIVELSTTQPPSFWELRHPELQPFSWTVKVQNWFQREDVVSRASSTLLASLSVKGPSTERRNWKCAWKCKEL